MTRFFALSVPVPIWFALVLVALLLGMNWCVREQLRLVRWFYENRPAPLPDDTDDDRCICGHEWGLHLGAKLNHACAAERCGCKSFTERPLRTPGEPSPARTSPREPSHG